MATHTHVHVHVFVDGWMVRQRFSHSLAPSRVGCILSLLTTWLEHNKPRALQKMGDVNLTLWCVWWDRGPCSEKSSL